MKTPKSETKIDYTDRTKSASDAPSTAVVDGTRWDVPQNIRPRLVKLLTDLQLESLAVGGPMDAIAAALDETHERLMESKEWLTCHWYVRGIAEGLRISLQQVLDVAKGHLPTGYPDAVVNYINTARVRRHLDRLPIPLELGQRGK